MRFLVAGGAGFIGSHVCERLIECGHSVTCLDNELEHPTGSVTVSVTILLEKPEGYKCDGF